ncbi:hypothetical protein ACIBCN_19070 [Nocardia sp. NPDC051052]|uniref:hypothetical protein n=1 Tax=Nocardia sp. NPDC051052 TaxID=3364322 RepID=UPI0037BCE220
MNTQPTALDRAHQISRYLGLEWTVSQPFFPLEAVLRAPLRRCLLLTFDTDNGDLRIGGVIEPALVRFVDTRRFHTMTVPIDTADERIAAQITEAFLDPDDPSSYESAIAKAIDAESHAARTAAGCEALAAQLGERLSAASDHEVFIDGARVQLALEGTDVRFVQVLTDHSLSENTPGLIDGSRFVIDVTHPHTLPILELIAAYIAEIA